jgi:hypothetical protein
MRDSGEQGNAKFVEDLLPDVSDSVYRIGVGVLGLALFALLVNLKFCPAVSLPRKPAKPETNLAEAKDVTKRFDNNRKVYDRYLKRDSRKYGVEPAVDSKAMEAAIPYQETIRPVKLDPKGRTQTVANGLQLSLKVKKIKGTHLRQMVLRIENLSEKHVAYQIHTRPSKGVKPCSQKEDIRHNALAIEPGGVEERSECIWRKGWGLEINRVETMELNELSYLYVSQLPAASLPVDLRVVSAHRPVAEDKPCKLYLPSKLKRSIGKGETGWRDIIDFFARHRCKTYDFPSNYKAWTADSQGELPAVSAN